VQSDDVRDCLFQSDFGQRDIGIDFHDNSSSLESRNSSVAEGDTRVIPISPSVQFPRGAE
jgi:hypothetical protein